MSRSLPNLQTAVYYDYSTGSAFDDLKGPNPKLPFFIALQ
jgi:hypothetical protein